MPVYLNLSIVLVVFMGLASGGLLALMLIAGRRQQRTFSVMFGLTMLLALMGAIGAVTETRSEAPGFISITALLVLSFMLGYALTTISVLSPRKVDRQFTVSTRGSRQTAVICLAPGESPEYEVNSAIRSLELGDNSQDGPPFLLRPFYMQRLKAKYHALNRSPYIDLMLELCSKVQQRLSSTHRVYPAFHSGHPDLIHALTEAAKEGAGRIIVVHVQVTDPPDAIVSGEMMDGLGLDRYSVQITNLEPLWSSELLPQIYVRRMLQDISMSDAHYNEIGLLLVGQGHPASRQRGRTRQYQEESFLLRLKQALTRVGFDERLIVIGWLWSEPTIKQALRSLRQANCKWVYCMPATFPADGITTLYDVSAQLAASPDDVGMKIVPLGAWNADDLAAEEIAARVRAAERQHGGVTAGRGR